MTFNEGRCEKSVQTLVQVEVVWGVGSASFGGAVLFHSWMLHAWAGGTIHACEAGC